MAFCGTLTGRNEIDCKDALGGIRNIYLMAYQEDVWDVTDNEIAAIPTEITEAFKYELRNDTNTFTESKGDTGRETGVTLFDQNVVSVLKKIDKESAADVNVIAKSRPFVVVQDRNGGWRLAGLSEGMDATIEGTTGAAKADLNGYTITFVAQEGDIAPFLSEAAITELEALIA